MNCRLKNIIRRCIKAILWVAGIWLAILLILETVLSPSVLTGLVNRLASEYVDGNIRFEKVSASMFRHFPSMTLTLEEFSVTYPSDRFDSQENEGVRSFLTHQGCGEEADTLAYFRKFSAAVNLPALLTGTINIPYLRLDKPRIYAHSYSDGSANWNIFETEDGAEANPPAKESTDSAGSGPLPRIILGKVMMTGHPRAIYTDSRDTIFAAVSFKKLSLGGRINTRNVTRSKIGLSLDTLALAGRMGRDTVSFLLNKLDMHRQGKGIAVDASAKAFMASRTFGRMMVPMGVKGLISFPADTVPAVKAENLRIDIAHIPARADAALRFRKDATSIDAVVEISDCIIGDLIDKYADNFMPELNRFSTDARISVKVSCNGDYKDGKLPPAHASMTMQEASIRHTDFPDMELRLGFNIEGKIDNEGKAGISIKKLKADTEGMDFTIEGQIRDLLGKDPEISVHGGLTADMDSLCTFIPDSLDMTASGQLRANVCGKVRASQLNLYNFSQSSLTGEVTGEGIKIVMPSDTINVHVDGLKIVLKPEEKTSKTGSKESFRLMGITGEVKSGDISYKDMLEIKTSGLRIAAKNAVDQASSDSTRKINPFGGSISADRLSIKDSKGSSIRLDSTWNGFQILPKKGRANVPVLTLNSRNRKIFLKSEVNRAMISNADISASAVMNTIERRQKIKAFRDSLVNIYPDIPKDSLFLHMMAQSSRRTKLPEWLKEEDFRKQDIDIRLDKTLAGYFRDWDLNGDFKVGRGMIMTPYFPLRNTLNGFDLSFTNDKISIERFEITSGRSDISVTGRLTGLKRALLGRRGIMKLDVDIDSKGMDANQLLAAYSKGSSFNPASFKTDKDISDEEFLEQVIIDSTSIAEEPSLIVVPANLVADISLNASDIKYSELDISKVTSSVTMKERCIRITDTEAITNMGEISLEAFYATRSKKDINTGFSLNFKDITAEKVIRLMPAVDTIMPLLKSFGGLLNCELAATARLDTNMNIIMPSINGVMRVGGDNLTIGDNDMFRSLAKTLLFKNRKEGRIRKMTVEGFINKNKLEVFPFILEMDRYTLGLSGVQNLDKSFRYHASLIRSPFLIKVGVDLYGPDFDNIKFKIGKAKYKSKDVPVFSKVIDRIKVNLVGSINNVFDKGVDTIMKEGARTDDIDRHKKSIGYVQAVDQKMEELSADEKKQLEEQESYEQSGVY